MYEDKCLTCKHYLGGGYCKINLEAECAAGYFEAWEPKNGGSLKHDQADLQQQADRSNGPCS